MDFKVLPLKYSADCEFVQYILYKPHESKKTVNKAKNVVFAVGIPPYCNKDSLYMIFGRFGKIRSLFLHSVPKLNFEEAEEELYLDFFTSLNGQTSNRFKVAYIVYYDSESVKNSMKNTVTDPVIILDVNPLQNTGYISWVEEYKNHFPNPAKRKAEIEAFVQEYDRKAAERLKGQVVDDEGWTVVTSKSRRKSVPFTQHEQNKLKDLRKKRHKKLELKNFYSFQMKQSQMEKIVELRKKTEEDKKRIEKMKAERKFKPF